MIKNVIFDYGQVLVHFKPEYMTRAFIRNEEDARLVSGIVFDREYWDKLDAGTISDEEVIEKVKARLPERLQQAATDVYYGWIHNIPAINGMEDIVVALKEKGINLCLLSNISKYFAAHYEEAPVLKHIDKLVFSSTCGMAKPNKEIFLYALRKYQFKAEETLFIDDRYDNIRGAMSVGINGYLFNGEARKLKEYLILKNIL